MMTLRFAAVLLLAVLAGACSSPQAASPGAGPATANTPVDGGRLNLDISFDLANLDHTLSTRQEAYWTSFAYSRLLRFKSGPDVQYFDQILEPEVAERWDVSPDAKTFTFHLRKGVKFANLPPVNGRELTSADVKFTLEYIARIGEFADKKLMPSRQNWTVDGLEGVDTPDPYTAVVRFKKPFVPFLAYSTVTFTSLFAREVYDKDGDFRSTLIGSGPFQLSPESSQRGSRFVWKKHPGYWEQGKPHVDEVQQFVLSDEVTAQTAFAARQLDMLTERVGSRAPDIQAANPNAVAYNFQSPGPLYLWLNIRPGRPFADERLRKAFTLGLDREEMIKLLTGGKGSLALAGAFPDTFTDAEVKQMVRYDAAESRRLLAEAGYPNGLEVEMQYANTFGQTYVSAVELMQAQLKKVGLNMTLKPIESSDVSSRRSKGDFMASGGGTVGLLGDVDSYLSGQYHPDSNNNHGKVDDPALTKMLVAQQGEADPAKRKALVRDIVRYVNDHALGLIVLFRESSALFWQPQVKGFYPNWASPGTTFTPRVTDLWLER